MRGVCPQSGRDRIKIGRTWHSGSATVLPDDDWQSRLTTIVEHFGRLRAMDAEVLRTLIMRTRSDPVTVRIDLRRIYLG